MHFLCEYVRKNARFDHFWPWCLIKRLRDELAVTKMYLGEMQQNFKDTAEELQQTKAECRYLLQTVDYYRAQARPPYELLYS